MVSVGRVFEVVAMVLSCWLLITIHFGDRT